MKCYHGQDTHDLSGAASARMPDKDSEDRVERLWRVDTHLVIFHLQVHLLSCLAPPAITDPVCARTYEGAQQQGLSP